MEKVKRSSQVLEVAGVKNVEQKNFLIYNYLVKFSYIYLTKK